MPLVYQRQLGPLRLGRGERVGFISENAYETNTKKIISQEKQLRQAMRMPRKPQRLRLKMLTACQINVKSTLVTPALKAPALTGSYTFHIYQRQVRLSLLWARLYK